MKKFLAIILSFLCLFFVGCGNETELITVTNKSISKYATKNTHDVRYCSIEINFTAQYEIKDLILEVPIYTYKEKEPSKEIYNKFEVCKLEIKVGTVLQGEKYIIEETITEKIYPALKETDACFDIGDPTVKSGEKVK